MGTVKYSILHKQKWFYGRDVVKIQCANHAVKCYHSKSKQLAIDILSFRGQSDLTKPPIIKITHGARCAIRSHSTGFDITKLKNDLHESLKHYLGIHDVVVHLDAQNLQKKN